MLGSLVGLVKQGHSLPIKPSDLLNIKLYSNIFCMQYVKFSALVNDKMVHLSLTQLNIVQLRYGILIPGHNLRTIGHCFGEDLSTKLYYIITRNFTHSLN